jgi:hypothetical protein
MEVIFGEKEIINESDVEQKQLYPIFRYILGYEPAEIITKQYLQPKDIGKGEKKIRGYFPDYGVVLEGFLSLIAEAKHPNENAEKGYADAQLYALEINKEHPKDINPVRLILASNGKEIVAGFWESEPIIKLNEEDFFEGNRNLESLKNLFSRESVLRETGKLREKLFPTKWYKPLKFIGGPARQNAELPPNKFAKDLAPLLLNYFDPDYTHAAPEILSKAYVSTTDTTNYDEILESLLKDNIKHLKTPGAVEITTTETEAFEFSDYLRDITDRKEIYRNPFLLIIGGVGVGKSMFLDRFFTYLIDPEIQERLVISKIDFNNAPAELEDIDNWICTYFTKDLRKRLGLERNISYEELQEYFEPEIKGREKGPYKYLSYEQPEEFQKKTAEDLASWVDDPKLLAHAIARYYSIVQSKPIIGIFDNVDRRDREQQMKVFQAVQSFREFNNCFCILALRDETYDGYKHEPPLDTILPINLFRINPPRFIDVIAKRLDLVIRDITSRAEEKLSFTIPGGITFTYPNNNLGIYLKVLFASIFSPVRKIRFILEALAGRNVRNALQLFSRIIMSSFVGEERLLRIMEGGGFLSDGVILRALMRTSFRYFKDTHGYTQNIFWLDEKSRTMNNFILIEVLNFLSSRRKFTFGLKIEGYIIVKDVLIYLRRFGFSKEDILAVLNLLLKRNLILAENQRLTGLSEEDYVKIAASGYIHLRRLPEYLEYVSSVALDTWFSSEEPAANISNKDYDNLTNAISRFKYFENYLLREFDKHAAIFPAYAEPDSGANLLLNKLNKVKEYIAKKESESETR